MKHIIESINWEIKIQKISEFRQPNLLPYSASILTFYYYVDTTNLLILPEVPIQHKLLTQFNIKRGVRMNDDIEKPAESMTLFRTEAERDPLQFIELKENLLNVFSKMGYDLVKSKSLKKQLIATQRKLIVMQNKRIDYAFELSFAYEKQETYNRYTEKIREIQKSFSSLSAQTIDELIDILDVNIDRLHDRYFKVNQRYLKKYENNEITLEQYKYEIEVRFRGVVDNAMNQTTNNINHLIEQYEEQTYMTLNSLNSALKKIS